MTKTIELAKQMAKEIDKNWLPELEEYDLKKVFSPIYKMNLSISDANLLVCFIIYAYDPDSPKLDIRKERSVNKESIFANLGGDANLSIFKEILNNGNEEYNNVVLSYLETLTTWQWQTIFSLLDYHSNMIRFVNQKTESEKKVDKMNKEGAVHELVEDYDIDTVAKVNKQKGELLELAIKARERAEKLLADIKKDFVSTDTAVQADLNFVFTDTAKTKVDIMSWRSYIKGLKQKSI